jgi:branched-chain amino acid transport system permease protein
MDMNETTVGEITRAYFHRMAKPIAWMCFVGILFLIPLFLRSAYAMHILISTGMNIILASSLRLIFTSGQLSLAHGGMVCVGAYVSALLVMNLGLSSWAALLLAGASAAGLAFLVGFPFVRLKGIYFAIGTIFLGQMIVMTGEQWESVTGGSLGIFNIPRPDPVALPGIVHINFDSKVDFYYLTLVLNLITLLLLYGMERSRLGQIWSSIRQADFLAESVGVNVARFKVLAFGVGCFFAGLVGGLYGQYMSVISPRAFDLSYSVYAMVYMVAGGMNSFYGPALGAFILTILPEFFRPIREYEPFVFAGLLLLIIFFLPGGLVSLPNRLRKALKGRNSHA